MNSWMDAALGGAAVLAGRYIWDRWLSQSSRVTPKTCDLNRALCGSQIAKLVSDKLAETTGKIDVQVSEICMTVEKHKRRLSDGDTFFRDLHEKVDSIFQIMAVMSYAISKLCEKEGIACDDIVKILTGRGIVK